MAQGTPSMYGAGVGIIRFGDIIRTKETDGRTEDPSGHSVGGGTLVVP